MEYIKVNIKHDESGHDYLIPSSMEELFDNLLDMEEDGEGEFENNFSKFRIEGSYAQLYVIKSDIYNAV